MKGQVYFPVDFELYDDDIFLWDEYGEIKEDVKEAIYLKPLFSYLFIDDELHCMVWWNDELGYWCGATYVNWDYVHTYICESLDELADEFLKDYDRL